MMLNAVDIVFILFAVLSVLVGYVRGLSGELAQLVSIVTSFLFGLAAYRPVGDWLTAHTRLTERPAAALAFIVIVVASAVVMVLIRYVLRKVMKVVFEDVFDKIGGCLAGLVRAVALTVIVVLIMTTVPHPYLNRIFGEESAIGSLIVRLMPELGMPEGDGPSTASSRDNAER